MADKITVDKKTLRALGADTRVDILKRLASRRKTQAELASELGLSAPSVKEHLDRLADAGLVNRIESEHKWKYYELSEKGEAIAKPSDKPVFFLLGISLVAFAAVAFQFFGKLTAPAQTVAAAAGNAFDAGAPVMAAAKAMVENAAESTPAPLPQATSIASQLPLTETVLMLVALAVAVACVGILVARHWKRG